MSEINRTKEVISILKEQILECQKEIANYNSIFISSTVLSSILAAVATVIASSNENQEILWKFFYILPTIYLLSVYNLIKYTTVQINLEKYRKELGIHISSLLNITVPFVDSGLYIGTGYKFWGGIIQVVFYFPIAILMGVGFWNITHDVYWWIMAGVIVLQSVSVVAMGIRLLIQTIQNDNENKYAKVPNMPKTGEKSEAGTYTCDKCGRVVVLDDNFDTLPPCPKCNGTDYH